MVKFVERLGPTDEETLQFLASNVTQELCLKMRLDTLRCAPHAQ